MDSEPIHSESMHSEQQEQSEEREHGATNYGDRQYWDKRYENTSGKRFDWLQNYKTLKEMIQKEIQFNKQAKILNIGCGNGEIQDKLYEEGYTNIINNDISQVVINQMLEVKQAKQYQSMIYEVMDVRKMAYKDHQFDLIIDKSTIDALLCSDSPIINTCQMLQEVYRVLKPNGIYFVISYGLPNDRMPHLQRQHVCFTIQTKKLTRVSEEHGQLLTHYAYICRKKEQPLHSEDWCKQFYQKMKELEFQEYG